MADHQDFNQPIIEEFRDNDGTVATHGFGRGLVLLHHVGAKSGIARVSPVRGIRLDDDTWLIAASKGGAPEHPAWYYNLLAHPDVTIETPEDGTVEARADILTGDERDAGWQHFLEAGSAFADYERRTSRTIPVIALRRK